MNSFDSLIRTAQEKANNNEIIIVFSDYHYKEVINNWLFAIKKLNIDNYIVIATDEELYNEMSKNKEPVYFYPIKIKPDQLDILWKKRTELLVEILKSGIDIIHSDADAVWLENPLQLLNFNNKYDMIFSPGTYWPLDVHEKWGFVICFGFYLARSRPSTIKYLEKVVDQIKYKHGDQVVGNRILYENGITWILNSSYTTPFRGKEIKCSNEIIEGECDNFLIGVLPQREFQRFHIDYHDVYVKHTLSEKTQESIIHVLNNEGCWFLPIEKKEIML